MYYAQLERQMMAVTPSQDVDGGPGLHFQHVEPWFAPSMRQCGTYPASASCFKRSGGMPIFSAVSSAPFRPPGHCIVSAVTWWVGGVRSVTVHSAAALETRPAMISRSMSVWANINFPATR